MKTIPAITVTIWIYRSDFGGVFPSTNDMTPFGYELLAVHEVVLPVPAEPEQTVNRKDAA
jgi:hypothetical protein